MVDIELGINIGGKRCKKCGATLHSGFAVCERCGEPVGDQVATAAAAGGETVIGVLANATQARGFGRKTYNLVVTDQRIILAELTSKMIAAEGERVAKEAKERGENFLAQMGKRALAGVNLFERYYQMAPDAILAENKDNAAIPIAEIRSCDVDRGEGNNLARVTLQSPQGKSTFTFDTNMLGSGRVSAKDAKEILQRAGVGGR